MSIPAITGTCFQTKGSFVVVDFVHLSFVSNIKLGPSILIDVYILTILQVFKHNMCFMSRLPTITKLTTA